MGQRIFVFLAVAALAWGCPEVQSFESECDTCVDINTLDTGTADTSGGTDTLPPDTAQDDTAVTDTAAADTAAADTAVADTSAQDTSAQDTPGDTATGCTAPEITCSSTCVNPNVSEAHCGACDNACAGFEICREGSCIPRHFWTQLALWSDHSCALNVAGEIYCWGDNGSGQLGLDHTERRLTPQQVDITGGVQIEVDYEHTCARLDSGGVACWGEGANGRLGHGDTQDQRLPKVVQGVDQVVDLGLGYRHTCVVRDDGSVWCWGDNAKGQLGLDLSVTQSWVPSAVPGITGAKRLAVGRDHSCALLDDDSIVCWGDNESGQIDQAQKGNGSYLPPTAIALSGVPVGLSLGEWSGCAWSQSGVLECWGQAENGQIPSALGNFTGVVEAHIGRYHGCLRLDTGKAHCWGSNSSGQVGIGSFTDNQPPQEVPVTLEFTQVRVGVSHSCGLLALPNNTQRLACWGNSGGGRFGNGLRGGEYPSVQVLENLPNPCPPGEIFCGGQCRKPLSSAGSCGAVRCDGSLGATCGSAEVCDGTGQCASTCAAGYDTCGAGGARTCYTHILSDPEHCGGCDQACNAGETCNGQGSCGFTCAAGTTLCDETCIDTQTDPEHCGGCNQPCYGPTFRGQCVSGVCQITCLDGTADCNSDPSDGCERDLAADPDHCSACDTACPEGVSNTTSRYCESSSCDLLCGFGLLDCDGDLTNGCEVDRFSDNTHCGACNNTCTGGETCQSGSCK